MIRAVAGHAGNTWTGVEQRVAKEDATRVLDLGVRRGDSLFTVSTAPSERRAFLASLDRPHPPVVGDLSTGQPAYLAGLKEGDRILALDGQAVRQFGDIRRLLAGKAGHPVVVRVRRGDADFDVPLRPAQFPGDTSGQGFIGIEEVGPTGPRSERLRYPLGESVTLAFQQTLTGTVQVYDGLWTTITRFWQVREQMGGPIFIAQMASEAARKGFEYWLNLMAMISLAVMAFNLLPIPLRDGGHIFLALLQAVRRRAMSARGYLRFMRVGLIFVGLLFVFIVAQDVMRPLRRMQ
ncbi:MAG TPA: M50 family metallopeptidase, partial [Casimicrobiaceae bacterium]|nr:M50 family metallopeptidase [Casimicrobiaceae bacterium]